MPTLNGEQSLRQVINAESSFVVGPGRTDQTKKATAKKSKVNRSKTVRILAGDDPLADNFRNNTEESANDVSNNGPAVGYPDVDWAKTKKTSVPSQCSTPKFKAPISGRKPPSARPAPADVRPDSADPGSRVYITEFSEDGDDDQQSDLSRDTDRYINVLDDDDDESMDSNSLPPPRDGVDIFDPDGYDTDLDTEDIDNEAVCKSADYDSTGIKDYIKSCNALGVIPVSYFQRHVQERQFVMRNHGLGPIGAKAISKPLEGNTFIESLDIEGNCIEGAGAAHLCRVLSNNCYITKLVLSENCLGSVGAAAVCEMLTENTTMLIVDLSGNGFKDSDGESIYKLIEGNHSVRTLILRHNNFEVEAARWIRDAMTSNETLRELDLSWNHFRLKGTQYLAQMIEENYGLKYLNLAMNGLGNEGAASLGHALSHNQCLAELNISNNRIGDDGVVYLAKGLEANEILSSFRMGMNPVSPQGSLPLLVGLYRNDNTNLRLLDLTNIVVTQEFESCLIDKIHKEKGRELQVIHGGILFKKKQSFNMDTDLQMTFDTDPMTKLRKFADKNKLRLIDVFRRIDRDNSMTLSKDEFMRCIERLKKYDFDLTPMDVEHLIQRLDKDGDGELSYAELVDGDAENRVAKRRVVEWRENKDKMAEQGIQTDTFELNL